MKHGTLTSYIIGFFSSIVLTLLAFAVVSRPALFGIGRWGSNALLATILTLAVVQLVVQLLFFLHLGSGSRSETAIFVSTLALVLLIVVGSIWIMNHLNYNMTPDQINQYMQDQQGGF